MKRALCLSVIALFSACKDKGTNQDQMYDFAGIDLSSSDTAEPGDLAGPTGDMSAIVNPPGSPVIEIVSPMLPTEDVKGNQLKLRVKVTSPTGKPIFAVSFVTNDSSTVVTSLNPVGTDLYEGSRDISGAGPMGDLQITAEDSTKLQAKLNSTFRHDRGPTITFIQPTDAPTKGTGQVRVTVFDALYPTIDPTKVVATVRTTGDVTLAPEAGSNPLQLSGTINYSSFSPPLDGAQTITVQAQNSQGTISKATRSFTVDNAGPDIVLVSPVAGSFAGGIVQIEATITDISNINDGTVVAVFAGNAAYSTSLTRATPTATKFTGSFDIRTLGTLYVFPTISIRADDLLGNHGELAVAIVVDNTPPILSLDPPKMRVGTLLPTGLQCSNLFDPLGAESVSDGQVVPQIIAVKARIEDRGNFQPGLLVERISDLDLGSIRMVAVPAPLGSEIVAVDTNGDGVCDDVNPALVPTSGMVAASNQSIQLAMTGLTSVGTADYYVPGPAQTVAGCTTVGVVGATPTPLLCSQSGTQMTYALQQPAEPKPAIFTIPPVDSTATGCIGYQFDTLNRMPEGPACLVVAASDNTGNQTVSAPMRICIKRTSAVGHPCNTWTPPNCTGTYNRATNTTTATPCTPRPSFPAGEIRVLN